MSEPSTRRHDLIAIAATEFARRGYRATTMRHIADAAGILAGSLYHHFKSKEEILREVMLESTVQYVAELEEIASRAISTSEKIEKAICHRLELYQHQGMSLGVVLQTDKTTLQETMFLEMRQLGRRIDAAWDKILEEGKASGQLSQNLETRAITYSIVGMLNWAHRWYDPAGRLEPRALAKVWAQMVLSGILTGDS
jgi:TetR/AcrR family transcriptional regulator, cholesterol catabolism regulator